MKALKKRKTFMEGNMNYSPFYIVSAGLEPAMLGNLHVFCVERY